MTKAARKPKMPEELDLDGVSVTGYCVKCRKKNVKMAEPFLTWTWNKAQGVWRPMVQGVHQKCGTKLTRFVNQEFVDDLDI